MVVIMIGLEVVVAMEWYMWLVPLELSLVLPSFAFSF
jgi:hypothetical protein